MKIEPQTQVCKCCGRELPLSEFRQSRLGLLRTCKECISKHQSRARLDKKIAKMKGEELENAKKARLSDFTPRELMAELKRRGYDGTLTYTEVKSINISKL